MLMQTRAIGWIEVVYIFFTVYSLKTEMLGFRFGGFQILAIAVFLLATTVKKDAINHLGCKRSMLNWFNQKFCVD